MSKLEKFLKESNLSDDAKKLILEAWNDEKEDLASEIRVEMKNRYTEDLTKLTEGLNQAMGNVITSEMESLYEEKRKLVQDRVTLRESLNKFYGFSNNILSEEVKNMRKESKYVKESLTKFMKFSNVILSEEVSEFQHERRELVESRVRLLAEGNKQITKLKKEFYEKAAKATAKYIAESTEKHFKELRTDIMEARQNNFGRKIFEAFGSEFLKHQFNENHVLRSLNESITAKDNELIQTRLSLKEATDLSKKALSQIQIMEDKYQRKEIMAELTKPLTSQQKQIMESLLSATPTEKLNEDFSKYHKSVLRGTSNGVPAGSELPKAKRALTEGSVVTGNRSALETEADLEPEDLEFLDQLQKNAGI